MNARFLLLTIALTGLATAGSALAESALLGWQTTKGEGRHVSEVHLTGPTSRQKTPEKEGIFKGRFLSDSGEDVTLIALHKLVSDAKGNLQTRRIAFTITPQSGDKVDADGDNMAKPTQFETESLAFEPGESFVLIFKTKDGTEMVTVLITRLFVPS